MDFLTQRDKISAIQLHIRALMSFGPAIVIFLVIAENIDRLNINNLVHLRACNLNNLGWQIFYNGIAKCNVDSNFFCV